MQTITQLVLLEAGFDMRGLRLPPAKCAWVFELDHPKTSLAKQATLRNSRRTMPEHIRRVSIDFNCQSITGFLRNAGFDTSKPACWIWEGVTNYLAPEAVHHQSLREITASSAAGGVLLFTYIDRGVLEMPERYLGALKLMARLRSYSEPWKFGINPGEVRSYLAEQGFDLLKDLSVADVWQSVDRSGRGTHGYELYRLASAHIGR